MRYENGVKFDERARAKSAIARNEKDIASRECFLIFSVFALILCLPIVGLFFAGNQ